MKYKAIMLDLDDTTVIHGKDNLPSDRVSTAIRKAKERIHVCIATARTLADAMPVMSHLDLSGPCIITNGTQIYDPTIQQIVHEIPLSVNVVPHIYAICQKHNIHSFYYDGVNDAQYNGGRSPKKILSIYIPEVNPSIVDAVVAQMQQYPGINVQKLSAWDKRYMSIDVTDKNASKLHGIIEVSKLLGIDTHEIIGVGDGYNDFPLLMACGLKIAMGNAVQELKEIADFIAPTVFDDGVATIIEKFVLAG